MLRQREWFAARRLTGIRKVEVIFLQNAHVVSQCFQTSVFLILIAISSLMIGCSKHDTLNQSTEVWNAFVGAIKAGDWTKARGMYTAESRPYFELSRFERRALQQSTFSVIKEEQETSYIRLQVLRESDGNQVGNFYYLVDVNGQLRFQYPFILFATHWSVEKSEHFVYHYAPSVDLLYRDSVTGSDAIDTVATEDFIDQFQGLTGIPVMSRIDYYLCASQFEVERLSGIKGARWASFGPCIIAERPCEFAEVATALLRQDDTTMPFLQFGLIGYADLQRARSCDSTFSSKNLQYTLSEAFRRLSPDSARTIISLQVNDLPYIARQSRVQQYYVATAVVDGLVQSRGVEKFQELWEFSHTLESLEASFRQLYGLSLVEYILNLRKTFTAAEQGK